MTYLLTATWSNRRRIALFASRDEAIIAATDFVGAHNPIDGCSSEPYITDVPGSGRYVISRQSSFGGRRVVIQPVTDELTDAID